MRTLGRPYPRTATGRAGYNLRVKALAPVTYHPMGEPSGTIRDTMGGIPLTLSGGPTRGIAPGTARGDSCAMGFNGINQYASGTFAAHELTSVVSVMVWFRTSTTASAGLVSRVDAADSLYGFELGLTDASGSLRLYGVVSGSGGETTANEALGNHADDRWHCAVMTADGEFLRLYLDGVEVAAEGSYLGEQPSAVEGLQTAVAHGQAGGTTYFNGQLRRVAVWNRALSATEVRRLWEWGRYETRMRNRGLAA